MTIINKAKYALVPIVMVCTTVNASTLQDQIKKIDKNDAASVAKTISLANNDDLTKIHKIISELSASYTNEKAYELYEAITEAKKNEVDDTQINDVIQPLLKIDQAALLKQMQADKGIMDAGVTIKKGQEHDDNATIEGGIINTGGNTTTIRIRKHDEQVIERIMEVDTASTPKGLKYIQKAIPLTKDKTITPELLQELKKQDMEITETNMKALEAEIKALTPQNSAQLIEILTSGIKSNKLEGLKSALKGYNKTLDPNKSAEENIVDQMGDEEYSKYKGVKRREETKTKLKALYTKVANVTGKTVNLNDTVYPDEETADSPVELYNRATIEELVTKAENDEATLKEAQDTIVKLKAQIAEYEEQERKRDAKLKTKKPALKKIFGINADGADTIEELLDVVSMASKKAIATSMGYVPKDGKGDTKLLDEVTKLKNENAKLKAALESNKPSFGAGELNDEEKSTLQYIYNTVGGKTAGIMSKQWSWLKTNPVKPIILPNK